MSVVQKYIDKARQVCKKYVIEIYRLGRNMFARQEKYHVLECFKHVTVFLSH